MTKTQRIAQMTNEINRCAKITGLPYSKFMKVASIVLKRIPHCIYQDIAEEIVSFFHNPDMANINNWTADEIASLVIDLGSN